MRRITLLIIVWWIGAVAAGIALLLPTYSHYFLVGTAGWVAVSVITALILYEIKAQNKKKKELAES